MSRTTATLALAAAVLLSGCAGTAPVQSSSPASTAAPTTITVEYASGRVSGDTGRVSVDAGAPVTITITSDVADEAHLHGYDLETELTPGEPAELRFDATVPGVFELELHHAEKVLLLTLQVG
jgi:hypothetical protein